MPCIGSIHLATPFCQAGLAGYSDRAMRLVARRRGCAYAVTEALLDTILLQGGLGLKKSIDINDHDHPVAGQIIGSEPHTMAAAARILYERGYDVIDLNYACPVKKIKNKSRGGHMLRDAERGLAIFRAVRDTLPTAIITVSLRRAFDDTDEHRDVLYQLLDNAWQLGFAAARVHGRTVEQKYLGRADWSSLKKLKQHYSDKVIIGSGDVFTAEDAVRMKIDTGVDIVWIARGAIGNPWIFQDAATLLPTASETHKTSIAPPTIFAQRQALEEHFAESYLIHGEQVAGRRMRKMAIKYARFHPQSHDVKRDFVNLTSLTDWQRTIEKWYSVDAPGANPKIDAVDEVNNDTNNDTCESYG
jgi:tRNA-dihydrouridine synthase B